MTGAALMSRREYLATICAWVVVPLSAPVFAMMDGGEQSASGDEMIVPLAKSKAEWRELLTPAAYAVVFDERTERPFSSALDKEKRPGTYICAAYRAEEYHQDYYNKNPIRFRFYKYRCGRAQRLEELWGGTP
jgi:hypothetical protein